MPPSRKPDPPVEVTLMSNVELANALREKGVDVGPIIATTRAVYERKLAELLLGGPEAANSASEEEDMEDESYEEEELEPEEVVIPKVTRSEVMAKTTRTRVDDHSIRQRPPLRGNFGEGDYSDVTQRTHVQRQSNERISSARPQPATETKKRGMSWLVKIILLFLVAGLIYLVVINMEGTKPKPAVLSGESV